MNQNINMDKITKKTLVTTTAMENYINATYDRGSNPALKKDHVLNSLYYMLNGTRKNGQVVESEIFAQSSDITIQ